MLREDFITTQYIWSLENEHVFVTKARNEAERGNFYQFTRLVQLHTQSIRRQLDDVPASVEWAYIYIELWHRMGGHIPNYAWHSDNADKYHISKRLLAEHSAARAATNPCAEINISNLQSCVLASEPKKETPMSKQITFKTITYINNADVTALSDEQLIDAIKTIEKEIADLKGVTTKSKKIEAKISDAEATLAKVVEVLDAR
jgi:hypothetical protein